MMDISVVYSIGIRCYTEIILKKLNLIKFSSIFGSLNIKNHNNIIKCFDTNFEILFDTNNLVYSKDVSNFDQCNKKYGYRTLNKMFDNINDYHSATFAHHDLSVDSVKQHFTRGIERLVHIKNNNIPILFINISGITEFKNNIYNLQLTESIKNSGFNNFKIISIYMDNMITDIELLYSDDYQIIYSAPCKIYNEDYINSDIITEILSTHFTFNKLLTIDDFQK